ncbi:hypothetical protein CTH_0760 [Carboxydocella thermautotrophica]|nr:hypothetical protein CTH_0760 [Carboxydocella thermautotrophica]
MLYFIIGIISIIFFSVTLKSIRKGAKLFLLLVLIIPYFKLGHSYFNMEYIYIIFLFIVLLIKRFFSKKAIVWPKVANYYLMFVMYIFFNTIININHYSEITTIFKNFFFYVKPLILMFIFSNIQLNHRDVRNLLDSFVYLSIIFLIFEIGQINNNEFITNITLEYYSSPSRLSIQNLIEFYGGIIRGVSVFEHPAYASIYFLLSLCISIYRLLSGIHGFRFIAWLVLVFINIVGGYLTASATFISGIILLLLFLSSYLLYKRRFISLIKIYFCVLILIYLISLNCNYLSNGDVIKYQIDRVYNLEIFNTRFNSQNGFLLETISQIKNNFIFGLGILNFNNVFIGDSMWVIIFYYGGLVGFIIFSTFLIQVIHNFIKLQYDLLILVLWVYVFVITGFGIPSFFTPRIQDWFWAFVSIMCVKRYSIYLGIGRGYYREKIESFAHFT